MLEQTAKDGYDLSQNYDDCGVLLFSAKKQDVHSGGSGCGCSASVLCGYLLRRMQEGSLKSLLFCATGALLSPVSTWQGESKMCIRDSVYEQHRTNLARLAVRTYAFDASREEQRAMPA